jgi:CheY-like chemotaxis protein
MTSHPHSILLVEDDLAHAEITRRNLQLHGVSEESLVHVSDGQAAIDYLRGAVGEAAQVAPPDLILLDLRLPRVDGLEVLAHVKSDAQLRHVPVVVLTTSATELDLRGAYLRGANAYLVKPVVFKEFQELTRAFAGFWLQFNRFGSA